MKKNKNVLSKLLVLSAVSSVLAIPHAFADDYYYNRSNCPDSAINTALSRGASESDLQCLRVRDDFKVVLAWNSADINGKILKTDNQNVGQQVVNAKNMVNDYASYGMDQGEEYRAVIVAYGAGLDWLKNTTDQKNRDMIINDIMAKGIKIYACLNTMKSKNLTLDQLIPGVKVVPAGVTAVIDYENLGYKILTP